MYKLKFKGKLAAASAASLLTLSLGLSLPATASTVEFKDPAISPTYPGCAINEAPTGNDGGISYEWAVKMGKRDNATLINTVGAKSLSEIPPFYVSPDVGWTHTADWIALEVTEKTKLKVKVSRIEGVPFHIISPENTLFAKGYSRNMLIPGIAIYNGWDDTSCEDHRFNPSGNVDWSTLVFKGNNLNTAQKGTVEYEVKLMPGKYSIAVGGVPKALDSYPANDCDPADKTCYIYTGRHGYRMEIKTGH